MALRNACNFYRLDKLKPAINKNRRDSSKSLMYNSLIYHSSYIHIKYIRQQHVINFKYVNILLLK